MSFAASTWCTPLLLDVTGTEQRCTVQINTMLAIVQCQRTAYHFPDMLANQRRRSVKTSGPQERPARTGRPAAIGPGQAGISLANWHDALRSRPALCPVIERGSVKPSVGTLYAMANGFGLLLDDLFRDGATSSPEKLVWHAGARLLPGPVQRRKSA